MQMPDIRLRDYTAKIKNLIESDLHDEAIAHCQHILRHYPKHVETYCLLGEACLEKRMYREAIEFFQRTLSADPENFIARVGMGIIYDEQGALAEAIWQMELAFELAPGNAEVRRELQRLYAQRDGVEKSRLKLTRGALGRLYVRNGLYERALAEFRAVLRQEPELPSIRVALIEALWCEGRRLEAVETCLDLLEALPNCLKANLILGEIWMRGGHEDAGEEKLNVARPLDPENLVAQQIMGKDSPLPVEDIFVPELEVTADMLDLLAPIQEREVEPAPWEAETEELVIGVEEAFPSALEETWDAEEQVPDWLRDMGLAGAVETGLLADMEEMEEPTEEMPPSEELPEWLSDLTREEPLFADKDVAPPEEELAPAEEMPDWLRELSVSETPEPAPQPAEEVPEAPPSAEELPEWLRELEMHDVEEAPLAPAGAGPAQPHAPDEEMPAWLRELQEPEIEEAAIPPIAEAEEKEVTPSGEMPDWLRELGTPEAKIGMAEEEIAPAEEIPEWLRDLGAPKVEEAEEIAAPPVAEAVEEEEIAALPVAEVVEEELPSAEEVAPPVAEEPAAEAAVEEAAPPAEVPESLRALVEAGILDEADLAEAMAEMSAEELVAQQAEAVPEWLQELMGEEAPPAKEAAHIPAAEAPPEQVPMAGEFAPAGELPAWLRDLQEPEAEAAPSEEEMPAEEMPAWLQELETPAPEQAPADELPEWLREFQEVEGEIAPGEEKAPAEALPDWLAEIEPSEPESLTLPGKHIPEEEVPEWLRELEGGEAEEVAPPVAEAAAEEPLAEVAPPMEAAELVAGVPPSAEFPPVEEQVAEALAPAEAAPPEVEEAGEEPLAAVAAEPEGAPAGPAAEVEMIAPFDHVEMETVEVVPEMKQEPAEVPEGAPAAEVEMVAPFERVEIEEPAAGPSRQDELLLHLKNKPRDYQARMDLARLYAAEKDWNAALNHYEKLISARKLLPAVIDDLQPLLQEEVDQARLYQLLGDAFVQDDQLNKALEMYRLARRALTKR
jgi:tetratricopeptide (TPR) repeat protein